MLAEAIEILWEMKCNYTVDEIADRASCVLAELPDQGHMSVPIRSAVPKPNRRRAAVSRRGFDREG
jgi:hypothetical protein